MFTRRRKQQRRGHRHVLLLPLLLLLLRVVASAISEGDEVEVESSTIDGISRVDEGASAAQQPDTVLLPGKAQRVAEEGEGTGEEGGGYDSRISGASQDKPAVVIEKGGSEDSRQEDAAEGTAGLGGGAAGAAIGDGDGNLPGTDTTSGLGKNTMVVIFCSLAFVVNMGFLVYVFWVM